MSWILNVHTTNSFTIQIIFGATLSFLSTNHLPPHHLQWKFVSVSFWLVFIILWSSVHHIILGVNCQFHKNYFDIYTNNMNIIYEYWWVYVSASASVSVYVCMCVFMLCVSASCSKNPLQPKILCILHINCVMLIEWMGAFNTDIFCLKLVYIQRYTFSKTE